MPKKVLIIANPVAGGGRGQTLADSLERALRTAHSEVETWLTTLEQNGQHLAAQVEPGAFDTIAVVGGDGSLHDVLVGLRTLETPIALLPAGTANVWARDAGLPRTPQQAAHVIEQGHEVRARLFTANGERFFLFAGTGIDARIVERVETQRVHRGYRGGMLRWWAPGWQEFIRRPLADLTVTVDGRRLDGLAQVLVTRVRGYAAFLSMPTGIDIGDDQIHVLAFPRRSKASMLLMAARAACRRLRAGTNPVHIATEGPIRIESAGGREPFHLDGNRAGALPLEIVPTDLHARLVVP